MDKMGSYDDGVHSNRGIPARQVMSVEMNNSPREGAPIEITTLVAKTVHWLDHLYKNGHYSFKGVHVENGMKKEYWSYQQWYRRIKTSFDMCYYKENGIFYKDCYNETEIPTDSQLRPNYVSILL